LAAVWADTPQTVCAHKTRAAMSRASGSLAGPDALFFLAAAQAATPFRVTTKPTKLTKKKRGKHRLLGVLGELGGSS
jgi:hypothetical protein